MTEDDLSRCLLPGLPVDRIRACFERSRGNEIGSGKLASDESSAALAANAFGFFLDRPGVLPPLPGCAGDGWPATSVDLEAQMRFPWRGGLHPWLDAAISTSAALIGVESKRYEPFRTSKTLAPSKPAFSEAYSRHVWGDAMGRYEQMRDTLMKHASTFAHLDAPQLVKHAFGLRTQATRDGAARKRPVLFYLYAEPSAWPDRGRSIPAADHTRHREEVARFSSAVAGDEVAFRACSYRELLDGWEAARDADVRRHAQAVRGRFAV